MTRIPIPVEIPFTRERLARGMKYLPLVGGAVGAVAVGSYYITSMIVPGMPALFASLTAWVLITGALHLDGLADTFDGVFSYRPRERILEIMKDSRLGTNGGVAVVLVLMAKLTALYSLEDRHIIMALISAPVAGRLALVLAASLGRYARAEEGLGSFVNDTGPREFIPALVLAMPALALDPVTVSIAAGSALAVPVVMHLYLNRKLGGVTGDTLGACVELAETWVLWTILIVERVT